MHAYSTQKYLQKNEKKQGWAIWKHILYATKSSASFH